MTDDLDDLVISFAGTGRREPNDREERDGMYAEGRFTDRTYASPSFPLAGTTGTPARFVYLAETERRDAGGTGGPAGGASPGEPGS